MNPDYSKADVEKFFADRVMAAILIRSAREAKPDIRKTLELMKLTKKNSCGFYKKDVLSLGMLRKVKDYITYGEVDAELIKNVLSKKKVTARDKKNQPIINYIVPLHPPIGGFERKGIKTPFTMGGALGNRGENMKKLILKMLQ